MRIKIGNKWIGHGERTFIVAEISANHNQDYKVALKTIEAIKKSGADAVKLQTYTPDTITIDADTRYFKIRQKTVWDGQTLYGLYQSAYTPWEWHQGLKEAAQKLGLIWFSTPFDFSSVDFLETLKIPVYKIASFEMTDIPLIQYVARKKKPIIFSTGISEEADIKEAIAACHRVGNKKIIILKCVSAYPARPEDMNLHTMVDMEKRFGVLAGLSDHTLGGTIPTAAAVLGAKIIEKHFILDKKLGGPDASFSLDPAEFKNMVDSVRTAEASLGHVTYQLSSAARRNRAFSRSLFFVKDTRKGDIFSEDNFRSIRPGFGLHPRYAPYLTGKMIVKAARRGMPVTWNHLSPLDRKSLAKIKRYF